MLLFLDEAINESFLMIAFKECLIIMEFCECGSLMTPVKEGMQCRSCGKIIKKKTKHKIESKSDNEGVVVIEDNTPSLPTTEKECPKCSHGRAYWWLIQTRSSDEPPTQFYKCVKCKNTWREYK